MRANPANGEQSNPKADANPNEPSLPVIQEKLPEHANTEEPKQDGDKASEYGSDLAKPVVSSIKPARSRLLRFLKRQRASEWAIVALTAAVVATSYWQWQQISEQNEITRDALRVSQAAYVTVGRPDGTIAEFLPAATPNGTAGLVMYFQNSGNLPATFNWAELYPMMIIPPLNNVSTIPPSKKQFVHMHRARNLKDGSISGGGTEVIAGKSTHTVDLAEFQAKFAEELLTSNRVLMLWGAYEYCDSLGTYSCRQFMVSYRGGPFKRFSLVSESTCPVPLMWVGRPQPDMEYLSACQTFAEQEEENAKRPKVAPPPPPPTAPAKSAPTSK